MKQCFINNKEKTSKQKGLIGAFLFSIYDAAVGVAWRGYNEYFPYGLRLSGVAYAAIDDRSD